MVAQICGRTIVAVLVISFGCRTWIAVPTLDTVRTQNRERLSQLSVGMPKAEVLGVMGTETIQTYKQPALPSGKGTKTISDEIKTLYRGQRINNPYRTETSHTADGTFVEILLYYTDRQSDDRAITNDELTPLVIEGGVLAGWGWSYLEQNVEKYRIELRHR
jgi:hypothetical protein